MIINIYSDLDQLCLFRQQINSLILVFAWMRYIVHRICHVLLFVAVAFSLMMLLLNAYICSYEGKQMAETEIEMNADVTDEQMENNEKKTREKKEKN